jgi:hypothetical protein
MKDETTNTTMVDSLLSINNANEGARNPRTNAWEDTQDRYGRTIPNPNRIELCFLGHWSEDDFNGLQIGQNLGATGETLLAHHDYLCSNQEEPVESYLLINANPDAHYALVRNNTEGTAKPVLLRKVLVDNDERTAKDKQLTYVTLAIPSAPRKPVSVPNL